jgi:undecaprenyl-diphosphatase
MCLLAMLAVMAGSFYLYLRATDNLHVLATDRVYRSAQMTPQVLSREIEVRGIKSILNLRGRKEKSVWFRDELAVTGQRGVMHVDYALSAVRPVSIQQLDEILAVMDTLPQPILVHCEGGADRTGLVAAVWAFARAGLPPETAYRQLSLRYGHFPYLWSGTWVMDESYWAYVNHKQHAMN